jgi:uncharacterized protein involved in exopolysaccharide biosynthesis
MPLKRLVEIAVRRKWWIVVPVVLATAAGFVAFQLTPKTYRATTTILVSRDSVSEHLVRSTVTLRIEERMRSLGLQVVSRAYLEPVARKLGMIPPSATESSIEDTCAGLRKQVTPELDIRDFSWFRISVDDSDPGRAAGIANALAARFIEENSEIRAAQAKGTAETTAGWEQGYRLRLAADDARIAEFKRQNLYELPEQQPANAQFLLSAQETVTRLTSEIQGLTLRLALLKAQQRSPLAGPAHSRDDVVIGGPLAVRRFSAPNAMPQAGVQEELNLVATGVRGAVAKGRRQRDRPLFGPGTAVQRDFGCSARALQPLSSTSAAAISSWAASPDRGFRRADDPACAR